MNFQNQGRPLNEEGMEQVCKTLEVTEPEIWAVLTVETRGFGFLKDRRPQILFERHIFQRLTKGKHAPGNAEISNARPGGYTGGSGEYARLEMAMRLDRKAALESASWGIGQIMGFNYKVAGFASIDAMIAAMVEDENSQLLATANFISGKGLAGALQRRNWVSFARGYNGPDFKKNEYDTRLAAAHAKNKTMLPDLSLRAAQVSLMYLGFDPGPIDGLRGRRTRSALLLFQERWGLPATGDLDPDTENTLLSRAFPKKNSGKAKHSRKTV
ncbi:N-acetylmuramidase domain-containing protein [Thiovibrio sp. JS02]